MRYHDLRHGAASLMAAQGVFAWEAMETLGRIQIDITPDIVRIIAPEPQIDAADRHS